MKLSIIGTGNVGLVTGACFSAQGHEVRCVDIDAEKIERLRDLDISSSEPGLDDLVRRNAEAGRLSFTTDAAAAVAEAEVVFLCVETPQGEDGKPDLDRILDEFLLFGLLLLELFRLLLLLLELVVVKGHLHVRRT